MDACFLSHVKGVFSNCFLLFKNKLLLEYNALNSVIVSSNKFSAPVCLLSCDPCGLNVSVFAVVPQAP